MKDLIIIPIILISVFMGYIAGSYREVKEVTYKFPEEFRKCYDLGGEPEFDVSKYNDYEVHCIGELINK